MTQLTPINELPVSPATAYRMINRGELNAIKIGRRTFITNLEEYIASRPSIGEAPTPMPRGRGRQS